MTENNSAFFHKLYGVRKPRATYYSKDFIDYALMIVLSALVVGVSYGFRHGMFIAAVVLCAFTLAMFITRHGIELRFPLILKRPQDVLFMFVYKLQNLRPIYFLALGLLLLENVLILATPNLPHHLEWTRTGAVVLFWLHFGSMVVFRTIILADHLRKKELVREVLMQTPWKRVINAKTNITLEILHAYVTGLLTHIILIAPWYLLITHLNYSLLFVPVAGLLGILVHLRWLKTHNSWFYRDHWLGHNSELEFVLLHGSHHDAIPSGLIAVAGNGFLEGYLRHTLGSPMPFYNPIVSFLLYMYEVKNDIELHQYIPGVYPRLSRRFMSITQHSTHHYGRLEPYGLGVKLDVPGVDPDFRAKFEKFPEEIKNSIDMDEELTGFQWDNATHRLTLDLYDKYQN